MGSKFTEILIQFIRFIRHRLLYWLPKNYLAKIREITLQIMYMLSKSGRKVYVAGQQPIYVEWSRSAVDFNTWEYGFTSSFIKKIHKGSIVFDIGASLGEWSVLAASLSGYENIYIFEPNPQSWKHIEKIFLLNKIKFPGGIFNGFAANNDNYAENISLNIKQWPKRIEGDVFFENLYETKNLQCIKVDTYCNLINTYPDIIKIDVEGAEGEVIRGCENVLKNNKPIIFLSLHPNLIKKYNDSVNNIFSFLEQLGYKNKLLADESHEQHWLFEKI